MSIFEKYLKSQGYDVSKEYSKIAKLASLNNEEIKKWQDLARWEIVKYHFENNQFYKKHIGKLPEVWDQLPLVDKEDFLKNEENMLTKSFKKKDLYSADTSGNSGEPFKFYKNKEAHARTWGSLKYMYEKYGLTFKSKQARFYGISLGSKKYIIEKIKDWIMNRVRFNVFDQSDVMMEKILRKAKKTKFEYLEGYTSAIFVLSSYLVKNNIVLKSVCPSLKICFVTADMCNPEKRRIIEQALGVQVVNQYGTSEVSIIAQSEKNDEWLFVDENICFEIINEKGEIAKSGESGQVVITDLFNKAMPIIRYKINDIATLFDETVGDNTRLKKFLFDGREYEKIYLPSGRVASGWTIYYLLQNIFNTMGVLKNFTIRQTKLDTFVFELVATQHLNDLEIENIQKRLDKYLEPGLKFELKYVDHIVLEKSGKQKDFCSEIANEHIN